MIKLAVFDWNGTLIADAKALYEGVNKELAVFDLPPITLQQYRELSEIPVINFYKKFGISEKVFRAKSDAVAQAFHSYYEPRVAKVRTRSGARALLDNLHRKKIVRIVLSNHNVEAISLQLQRLKLQHHFEAILANDTLTGSHLVGKADRLKKYLQTSPIKPSEVVIIGDTPEEIQIGKKLGVKSISITGGYCTEQRLRTAGPDSLVHKLRDIENVIKEM